MLAATHSCCYQDCALEGRFRCSRCQAAFYCSADHQKQDWRLHKSQCKAPLPLPSPSAPTQSPAREESRLCRCMFCGEQLLLASEEAAVDHMRQCPSLQEQLQSNEQFTVPAALKERMKRSSEGRRGHTS
eukprot:gene6253-6894_t